VRTSRSTVGTMTELNDHLKLLFARAARLFCRGCGREVRRDTPDSVLEQLMDHVQGGEPPALITFRLPIPDGFSAAQLRDLLAQQGYTRIHAEDDQSLEVIQDRLRIAGDRRDRIVEAVETALSRGRGRMAVRLLDAERNPVETLRYSGDLHCPDCDIHYQDPLPNLFSFNSPLGACPTCRGFGRNIGIDPSLVVPDESKSLAEGAVRPFQSDSYLDVQGDLMRFAHRRGVDTDRPWQALDEADRRWVMEGEGGWDDRVWYGVGRFFDWLESKSYKMHIRVLLSKYRSYDVCPTCQGARLKDEALDFRLGEAADADPVLAPDARFRPDRTAMSEPAWTALPGLNIHDVMGLPLKNNLGLFQGLHLPAPLDQATDLLLGEIRARLGYLVEVGLGYLTLDRQSRTLSGGEVQRINLTTALGTSLVNTLFVLDEPSIGLHPRDIDRMLGVLHRLRDAGNSLLVVEHDPQIMLGADRLLDIGPGPGEQGGEILFFGTPRDLLSAKAKRPSLTGDYLSGRRRVSPEQAPEPPGPDAAWLEILGASEHNLRDLDARIPLNRLVCVTGVSGSGKSTLIQDVLFNALSKLKGRPRDTPGAHRALLGHERLADAVMLDQSPIGRTSRSNPASYVGAWDPIRKAFARTGLARERRYTPGTFSFNSGKGRCPGCSGTGFEHVEMQFLSDVYLRCPDCNGRRYRSSVLEVQLHGRSVADVLEMTVTEARVFFAGSPEVTRALEPLEAVGLSYLRLGQPVPTLSGGESQRLKLAGHLAKAGRAAKGQGGLLFLLDEPTTGLHFEDIAVLLHAFRRLLRQGHSLVVIEHNLDVIRAADWVIDLGPEGGDAGGRIVCTGTPAQVAAAEDSHTGQALRRDQVALESGVRPAIAEPPAPYRPAPGSETIEIRHAREHNLKDLDIRIPRDRFTVITGVSGSGKSTVAFDILFAEGQRRYLESLNAYARQFVQPAARADVDAVLGIPPTVAIEQRTSRGGHKSTVGTLTEIHHFLRLLFVKLGVQYCPECEIPIQPQSREAMADRILSEHSGETITLLAPLVVHRKGLYKELAKWADRKGYGLLRVDGELIPTDDWPTLDRYREHSIDLPLGELRVDGRSESDLRGLIDVALEYGKGTLRLLSADTERSFSTHRTCPGCGRGFEEPDPRLFSYNSRHGWCTGCFGTGLAISAMDAEQTGEEPQWATAEQSHAICRECEGTRLNAEALAVYFKDWSIADYSDCTVDEAREVFADLDLDTRERAIGADLLSEIQERLAFLSRVGLGYLSLDRAAPTLSGGEAQRIRLAAQLGSNLRGVCYILDEPTIGLHPRDNRRLLDSLQELQGNGNTLVVVEHDEDTIRRAEHLIDFGPGAGRLGGRLVAEGNLEAIMAAPESVTGRYLAQPLCHPLGKPRPTRAAAYLEIRGVRSRNLQDLNLDIPLERLVCVTGVSGSGKSTLAREVLADGLRERLHGAASLRTCRALNGWEKLERVLEVDQTPIGRTPRSCPATYVGLWDPIRRLFAATAEARIRGWGPGRFSFNTRGGRCEVCEGQGVKKVGMSFLPDVKVTCEVCGGSRFDADTLEVRYKGRNAGELLAMSVDEATDFFSAHPAVHHALELLRDVGLGYLTLGQHSPTLSGGEAQRIKLVTELAKAKPSLRRRPMPTLYVLDEPTVGLHMADVERLIHVLHRLVDAGHSVVVIEHNLDLIAEADWILDLGPEGGDEGGRIVAKGTPRQVAGAWRRSRTGEALRELLAR